jgi:hypothetical protein
MPSLFENQTYQEIETRIGKLTPDSQALWGKMTISQMLAHCYEPFTVPLGVKEHKRSVLGLIFGNLTKKVITDPSPYKKNLPTAKEFLKTGTYDFESSKKQLMEAVTTFKKSNQEEMDGKVHSFFGPLTADEWGQAMWKHLDHHLRQFGV